METLFECLTVSSLSLLLLLECYRRGAGVALELLNDWTCDARAIRVYARIEVVCSLSSGCARRHAPHSHRKMLHRKVLAFAQDRVGTVLKLSDTKNVLRGLTTLKVPSKVSIETTRLLAAEKWKLRPRSMNRNSHQAGALAPPCEICGGVQRLLVGKQLLATKTEKTQCDCSHTWWWREGPLK